MIILQKHLSFLTVDYAIFAQKRVWMGLRPTLPQLPAIGVGEPVIVIPSGTSGKAQYQ